MAFSQGLEIIMSNNITPTQNPSSIGSWALLIAQTIESYDFNSQDLFSKVGVDLNHLRKNNARIDNDKMREVLLQAQVLSDDPYFALAIAKNMQASACNALGVAMTVSQHGYDALKRLVRYIKYLNDGQTVILKEHENNISLLAESLNTNGSTKCGLGLETMFTALYQMINMISGKQLKLNGVYFRHDYFHDKKPFEEFFNCPVNFSADRNEITFDKESIASDFSFANSTLTSKLDEIIEEYLNKYYVDTLSNKVQEYFLKVNNFDEIDQIEVAKTLKLSPRMLQKKLKQEGVSYSKLLDACRQKSALKLISDKTIPLTELAFILGFADQSNFSRAFKRWSGSTPHQYRNNKMLA